MNRPQHDEMQEMLPAAALEILEGAELERLRVHLGQCPDCMELLRQYRDAAAGLALLAPARGLKPARSAALRTRLMTRVQADQGARAARGLRVDRWLGWMVAAGLAGILLVHHSVHRTLNYGWLAAGVLTLALVGLGLYARRQQHRAAELQQKLDKGRSNL
jgi:putative zinc finger protein